MKALAAQRLRELLMYEPQTGVFVWKVDRHKVKPGDVAGTVNLQGRRTIRVDGWLYSAHRLAWLYVFGEWPKQHIDHKDGNPLNNAIDNLRDVSPTVNSQNQRSARIDNTSGTLGVTQIGDRFRAMIWIGGTNKCCGIFDTPEAAHAAYVDAKRKHHDGCTI